jgi:hypothetical protein
MQVLDQEIAPPWPLAEHRAHLVECVGVDLAALGRTSRAVAPSRPGRLIVGPRVHAGILLNSEERDLSIKNKPPTAINRLKFSIERSIVGPAPVWRLQH